MKLEPYPPILNSNNS